MKIIYDSYAFAYEQWRNLPLYFVDSRLVCKEKLETLKDGIHLILSEKTRKPNLKMTDMYQSLFWRNIPSSRFTGGRGCPELNHVFK